jgi:putative endonuclease
MGGSLADVFSKCRGFWKKLFGTGGHGGNRRAELGRIGEDLAVKFLVRGGFKILTRNWTSGRGEIDIVAVDGNGVLVFVEVRLRAAEALVSGYFSIGKNKRAVLKRTCDAYRRRFAGADVSHRFDVVEVRMDATGKSPTIGHYENVGL